VDDVEVRRCGIPYGGAKGGVVCDPKTMSAQQLETLTRRYTTEIELLIGPDRDIPRQT
jgi:glutamate dehydrogenase (NAD(P)+)